jgi:hypothetical protein
MSRKPFQLAHKKFMSAFLTSRWHPKRPLAGETVFVFHPAGLIGKGRKLVPPWLGPYVVQWKLSDISYFTDGS